MPLTLNELMNLLDASAWVYCFDTEGNLLTEGNNECEYNTDYNDYIVQDMWIEDNCLCVHLEGMNEEV